MSNPIRLAARAIIIYNGKLLLVNAWRGSSDLWCAPGGGVEKHASLPDNLIREVAEETGLTVRVGSPCLVNEFHDIVTGFHQVDIYFRCEIVTGKTSDNWVDPEGIVSRHCWVTAAEMSALRVKPDSLAAVAWDAQGAISYDALEPLVR